MTERFIQRRLYWKYRSCASAILPNYTPFWWYECDMFVLLKSMYSVEFEIKVTAHDFRADFRKEGKHGRLEDRRGSLPTRFFYAMPTDLVEPNEVPDYAGLVFVADDGRLRTIKAAPRLTGRRHTEQTVTEMWRAASYRLWSERFRFDDFMNSRHEQAATAEDTKP